MKLLLVLLLALPLWCQSQTVLEFESVISGEEIHYFSPYKSFADQAWLSRCNGASPVEIKLKQTSLSGPSAQLKLLIGHSSGTNSGERNFDFYFNDRFLGTLTTTRPSKNSDVIKLKGNPEVRGTFVTMEEDINGDDFGYLTVDIPCSWLNDQNKIRMVGQDQQSRDWLMIFKYASGFKVIPQVTNLVLKDNNKRQLNVLVDCPYPQEEITLISQGFQVKSKLRWGYNTIELPGYNADFVGKDTLVIQLTNHPLTFTYPVEVKPIKPFEFHLIHHSHNDIGYSHLQEEVVKIQTENIRSAMRWMNSAQAKNQRAIWHVESLWAVENFLNHASPAEVQEFKNWVGRGNMVLSANYANVLTGLCREEEMDWMVEYAKKLEMDWGIQIQQAMITDIPGIGFEGLRGYVRNRIAYLSLGPNYVESQQDRGDRVGSIIQETGDTYFKWKSSQDPERELLVWTAGKGYSYFHSIQDSEKPQKWESKLSQYVGELSASSYPLSYVQLRYTKNADNGPVDSTLCDWVDYWNNKYSMPKLIVSSLPELFEKLEKESMPTYVDAEISPYWEDGAYSTAVEEVKGRRLIRKAIEWETACKTSWMSDPSAWTWEEWYPVHRNLVLWHEHTWGSWCSISDPELPFTEKQWEYKKAFLDSAQRHLENIQSKHPMHWVELNQLGYNGGVQDFEVSSATGGIRSLLVKGKECAFSSNDRNLFSYSYVEGLGEKAQVFYPENVQLVYQKDNDKEKEVQVRFFLKGTNLVEVNYNLNKQKGVLVVKHKLDKRKCLNKESIHVCLDVNMNRPTLSYGSSGHLTHYKTEQLQGSNYEFVCITDQLVLEDLDVKLTIGSPDINLVEVGQRIDEKQVKGAKVWSRQAQDPSHLFLYVLNNYWHTNFKAYQEGILEFENYISID